MVSYFILIFATALITQLNYAQEDDDEKDLPDSMIKIPSQVSVSGSMTCNGAAAYAVLLNLVERVGCTFCAFFLRSELSV
ncbi:unnamed protein product [Gongylonema pulchrum]|uniref:Secreted protein n=1 Tax=Gongylonema pulchrum TaxID=637853 RepID=A0A183DMK7_9BILA|nr:unnamed protein product [Gongylonema pulchrum]